MDIEVLTGVGLSTEQAQAVKKLFKDELDGKYIPKETFDAERKKVKDLSTQIKERDAQIEDLGKFKGSVEELEKKVSELTQLNEKTSSEYKAQLKKMEFDSAICAEISGTVHDVSDVLSKLNTKSIVVQEGKVVSGLKEQLQKLQETHPYYFKTQQDSNPFKPFGNTPKDGGKSPVANGIEQFAASVAESVTKECPVTKKVDEVYFAQE